MNPKAKRNRPTPRGAGAPLPALHPLTGEPVPRPLVPDWLFAGLLLCSLAVPNLIFSGTGWFDTLHLLKFFWALIPVAVLVAVAGIRLLRYGPEETRIVVDPFGWLWLFLILYMTLQPLWVPLSSVPTFVKEWFFLAALWATYVLTYNLLPPGESLRIFLWGAMIDASANILFAELQIRGLNGPFPFILPVPGNYIGNTGQQEMFALWLSMTSLAGIFLHVFYSLEMGAEARRTLRNRLLRGANLAVLTWVAWGLWNSTGRSGILALFLGLSVLALCLWRFRGRSALKPLGQALLLVLLVLALNGLLGHLIPGGSRVTQLGDKMTDMVVNAEKIGLRDTIWKTAWTMFLHRPLGVGLGHFKWTYIEAMRWTYARYPGIDASYTLWAHNEFLQWFCEAGWPGGLFLLTLGGWWLWNFLRVVRRGGDLPLEAMWGVAVLFQIWFVAIWSRPFHRIENALWMSLAFAVANRSILPSSASWCRVNRPGAFRLLGGLMAGCALAGILFMADGMVGDRRIHDAAVAAKSPAEQYELLQRARWHLMKRDDADKQTAYFYLSLGRAMNRRDYFAEGVARLDAANRKQPEMKDLLDLIQLWGQLGNREKVQEYLAYLKPGSYQIHSAPVPPTSSGAP